ncbi:MAG: P27 family phage terminase small subunit [Magnetococcus sp. WYHC-3]
MVIDVTGQRKKEGKREKMPGRPHKPTQLKVIEGNRGKRPLPENEPKPRPKAPGCPDVLDAEAKSLWRTLAPKLEKIGLLCETDGEQFASMCQIRSRLFGIFDRIKNIDLELKTEIDPEKVVLLGKEKSSLMKQERLYATIFRGFASEFGLSPRGRVGLTVGKEPDDDGTDLLS